MINSDLALWRSVVIYGLYDTAKGIDPGWLGSADFRLVCNLAQVNPEAVIRAYCPERFTGRRLMVAHYAS